MTEKACVIIISYNTGAKRLLNAVESALAQTYPNTEVIVFDNASTDNCTRLLPADSRLRVVHHDDNLGFAGGVNAAAKLCDGEYIALLNPDAIAQPTWLESLVKAAQKYPQAAAFGSVQIQTENPALLDGLGDAYHFLGIAWRGGENTPAEEAPREDKEIFSVCGAATLCRKAVFDDLGGFADNFFCYHEDVDLGARMQLAGYKSVLVHDSVILHEGSAITGRHSDFSVYHGVRNRVRTFIRTMPSPLFWPLLPVHFLINLMLLGLSAKNGALNAHWRGMSEAFFKEPTLWRERKEIQKLRKISASDYFEICTKSFLAPLRREADLREITPPEQR